MNDRQWDEEMSKLEFGYIPTGYDSYKTLDEMLKVCEKLRCEVNIRIDYSDSKNALSTVWIKRPRFSTLKGYALGNSLARVSLGCGKTPQKAFRQAMEWVIEKVIKGRDK